MTVDTCKRALMVIIEKEHINNSCSALKSMTSHQWKPSVIFHGNYWRSFWIIYLLSRFKARTHTQIYTQSHFCTCFLWVMFLFFTVQRGPGKCRRILWSLQRCRHRISCEYKHYTVVPPFQVPASQFSELLLLMIQ